MRNNNCPSKDKLPSCSTWFRQKAERKIMVARRKAKKLQQEHEHEEPVTEILG